MAIDQYDQNGDGKLQSDEWTKCPSIAGSIAIYDTNADTVLDESELAAGIGRWQTGTLGARPLPIQVRYGSRPLVDAEVKLIPEDFFEGAIKPASGKTTQGGRGFLGVAREELPSNAPNMPLVQPGLYRVEITHPSIRIPAKYNSESSLGLEVADDRIDPRGVVWELAP